MVEVKYRLGNGNGHFLGIFNFGRRICFCVDKPNWTLKGESIHTIRQLAKVMDAESVIMRLGYPTKAYCDKSYDTLKVIPLSHVNVVAKRGRFIYIDLLPK